jgi:hypothetical protein
MVDSSCHALHPAWLLLLPLLMLLLLLLLRL